MTALDMLYIAVALLGLFCVFQVQINRSHERQMKRVAEFWKAQNEINIAFAHWLQVRSSEAQVKINETIPKEES